MHHLKYFCFTCLLSISETQLNRLRHPQAFMTRSPRISGFQSSQEVSKPSAKRMQKFLKWPLLTRDSEEQAVISVLSMVRTRAEPVSKSMLWFAWQRGRERGYPGLKRRRSTWKKNPLPIVWKRQNQLVTLHSTGLYIFFISQLEL